ncbi:MAG: glycosyltransferase family 4 protein [Pirellulaceae bacterium]
MNHRPVIMTFVAYYLPGYKSGGPVRSLANMVERLSSDFDFRIVTADHDCTDREAYEGVPRDHWCTVGKASVYYTNPAQLTFGKIRRILCAADYDIMYINSFFCPAFSVRPLLLRFLGKVPTRPIVLAPRGELASGALRLKWARKSAYLKAAGLLGVYKDIVWQASSEFELKDIQRSLGKAAEDIIVAPNIPASTLKHEIVLTRHEGPLRICFLSRICRTKNLDFALRVLADVSVPIDFTICGVVEDPGYWEECRLRMSRTPSHVKITFLGAVEYERVPHVLSQHDLFFLPTLGENYGHVIHEALSSGLPVLISDRTPWRDLSSAGAGWDLPLESPNAFRLVIEEYSALSNNERNGRRLRAQIHAQQCAAWNDSANANIGMFRTALRRGI